MFLGKIKATLPNAVYDFLTIYSLLFVSAFLNKYTTSSLQSNLFRQLADINGHFRMNSDITFIKITSISFFWSFEIISCFTL